MEHAPFVPLHLHSSYSILSSTVRLEGVIQRARELRMPALALTDQGNLFAAISFYTKCLKSGIKPILGAQVYLVPDHKDLRARPDQEERDQLILLCRNTVGWKNLVQLVSVGHLEGSHGKPRIDLPLLALHARGLIALSAGGKGAVGRLLARGRRDEAKEAALGLKTLFAGEDGEPNFFLEIQRHGLPGEEEIVRESMLLAYELGIPLVASNDVHFLHPTDHRAQDALVCIGGGHTLFQENRPRYSPQCWFRTPDEMIALFADVPEAVNNTLVIARRCNVQLRLGSVMLPDFPVPRGETLSSWLRAEAERGLAMRLKEEVDHHTPFEERTATHQRYRERLEYELKVIIDMGFPGYFLIVSDFIRWAKRDRTPVGPGRGSGAGSLVAWSLEITDIDPIRYQLLFERFLNPERVSMPDFDVDFCQDRRERVIGYVQKKYGADRVAQIITFGAMLAKAVIRDVGRVLEMPYGRVDRIAKLVPNILGITLDEAIAQEERFSTLMAEEPEVAELIELARALEGLQRSAGTHAAGVVISDGPLTDLVPLYKDPRSEMPVTQFHKDDVELAGLIKFDFLGLKTLTVIQGAMDLINRTRAARKEPPLSIRDIDLTDRKTFQLLKSGAATGVFQLESSGMKEILKKLQPDTFEDIVALVALYRPGPLGSGMVDDFINGKHGRIPVTYPLPQLEPILQETYGVILYQEQVMKIAQVLAGYTLGGADLLRRAMGKKKPSEMAKQRDIFTRGAEKNRIDPDVASYIFDLMEKFAGYGFNKSHSAAYALISYQTAWLKAHHPLEFMAATMTCDMQNTDKVVRFVRECAQMGIGLLPPDVNRSELGFGVEEGKIRFGLAAIKNVGETAVEAILLARRQGGAFADLADLGARVRAEELNRRVLESLIKAGACDSLHKNRAAMFKAAARILDRGARQQEEKVLGYRSLFDDSDMESRETTLPQTPEWSPGEKLGYEKESLGFYITGHPLQKYEEELLSYGMLTTAGLRELAGRGRAAPRENDGRRPRREGGAEHPLLWTAGIIGERKLHRTRKGDRMAFLTLEDLHGRIEVTVFPEAYARHARELEEEKPVAVAGFLEGDEETPKLTLERLLDMDGLRRERCRLLRMAINPFVAGEREVERLAELLREHGGGPCRVEVEVEYPEFVARVVLGEKAGVMPLEQLRQGLEGVFGEGSVRFLAREE